MRTTLDLPDELLRRAKIAAVERGTTLRELIAQALAGELEKKLRGRKVSGRPWLGCLQAKTSVKEHSMERIRASIAEGRSRERA